MISYEEALQKARAWKSDIDGCTEYEHAYVFGCSKDDNYIGGYGHTPVVIIKETGERTIMPEFVVMYGDDKEIRSFEL